MDAKTRKKIELVLDEAAELTAAGMDEYQAARKALTARTSDVLKELATAAVVDAVRRRQRSNVLNVERQAERRPRRKPDHSWKTPEYYETVARMRAEFVTEMTASIERYSQSLKMEWTAELLASDFAMADGTRVTWGDATLEQHEERAALFQRNALANSEGAARHLKAVEALRESGRTTLNEVVGVAA